MDKIKINIHEITKTKSVSFNISSANMNGKAKRGVMEDQPQKLS